jgi:hypothetical protein
MIGYFLSPRNFKSAVFLPYLQESLCINVLGYGRWVTDMTDKLVFWVKNLPKSGRFFPEK